MLNALPSLRTTTLISVGLHTLVAGQSYTLRVPKWLNPIPGARVYLEDRQNGRTQELTAYSDYRFTAKSTIEDHRFFLRFVGIFQQVGRGFQQRWVCGHPVDPAMRSRKLANPAIAQIQAHVVHEDLPPAFAKREPH